MRDKVLFAEDVFDELWLMSARGYQKVHLIAVHSDESSYTALKTK